MSIRLASDAADVLGAPATNRLVEASDWTQFVPGSAIAQVVGASLGAAVGSVIKGDKNYGPGKAAAATYVTTPLLGIPATPPFVLGTAEVVAINACPVFNIDVSVELRVIATFVGNGPSIETTLHLSWSADSTWCQVADFFVATPAAPFVIASVSSDKASRAILGGGVDPAGFREIGRDDTSITYRQQRPLPVPAPLVVTASSFDSNGLTISGGMTYAPAGLGLQGWASSPTSGLLLDCGQRRVSVKFNPPQVGLLDHNTPGTPPRIFGDSLVVPANAWVIVTGGGNDTLETLVTFAEPSTGRLPAGTATSAFLSTDCGMRWVDLGVIPPDHAPPGTADTAAMLNKCMFRTASWKQRVLSYQWLPRPVEDTPEEAAVRQWLVGLTDMPADTRLQFVAVSAHGVERAIGETEGLTALAAHITTAKNETLEIRSNHDRNPPPQVAAQRWFSPIATLRLREPPMAVAAGAGLLGMRSHDGAISLLKIGTKGEIHVVPFASLRQLPADVAALVDELDRAVHSGRKPWNSMAQIDGRSGCVVHAGHLLIGRLGNQQNALAP